jgi:predicted enzyme related to lactoylglutathione lyase
MEIYMTDPNFIILYVESPLKSAAFYEDLFGKAPISSHPTFVLFSLDSGVKFGLWSKYTAEPAVAHFTGISGEIAFSVADNNKVDSTYMDWTSRGLRVAQKPTTMDFGYTFVLLDPDGHRLRMFCPNNQ